MDAVKRVVTDELLYNNGESWKYSSCQLLFPSFFLYAIYN